jgi:hypothetical protein
MAESPTGRFERKITVENYWDHWSRGSNPDLRGMAAGMDENREENGALVPGHGMKAAARAKKRGLRDVLEEVWKMNAEGHEVALRLAALAVGLTPEEVDKIPVSVTRDVQKLTAWVFAMLAAGGSVEHFKEFGDRLDPKPTRIKVDGTLTHRRAPVASSSDPREVAGAEDYYRKLHETAVDAEIVEEDPFA